jgi:hypothetical protein
VERRAEAGEAAADDVRVGQGRVYWRAKGPGSRGAC